VVGGVSLLWNCVGALDFVMTETRNAAYLKGFTQAQLDYFYNFPGWAIAAWGIATWGGVLGSLLLLARKGFAVPLLLVSFIGMVLTTIYNFGLSDGMKVMGGVGPLIFSVSIFVVGFLLWLYARAMQRRSVLR
jgi:CHASE2 domain-containing sensor protein